MAVLNVYNLRMTFADSELFAGVTFGVEAGEHIGFVGANGTGKTTLFRILTGELQPTDGTVARGTDVTLGYMEQHACAASVRTVYDELLSVFQPLMEMETALEVLTREMERGGEGLDQKIARHAALTEQFQNGGGLTYRSRTRATLLGLGFSERDFTLSCGQLSGGQRSKLSLGKLLLSGAQLLLLDEPTNHLDIDSVEWLEGFLQEYRGAVIVISHDRYFLDRVTGKTMELSRHTLQLYKGNYSEFLRQKQENEEFLRRKHENQMAEIKHIEGIIEQQRRWGRERNFITAASKQKMLDKKMEELVETAPKQVQMHFSLQAAQQSGNEVLTLRGLSKGYEGKPLFRDVSLLLMRGEKAFLLGPNGCGKTTLLRILMNKETADSGSMTRGTNVKVGYFDQSLAGLHGELTVLDEIWNEHRLMNETQVRSALALFLFRGEDVYKTVAQLSGGEKARLALLKLMLSGANLLLLDEPTNHLDVQAREALEQALGEYDGTILAVSHDRYFINKLCTRV